MNEEIRQHIQTRLERKKAFFQTQQTKEIAYRITALKRLKKSILERESDIAEALYKDLGKSPEETYITETSIVLKELNLHLRNVRAWAEPKLVSTPLPLFPSSSKIIPEPLGTVLIIAPFNYPFQLIMAPLIGALSSGCCALLKLSPKAPAIAQVMKEIITSCFDENYVSVIEGEGVVNDILLEQRFDLIFFTGSPRVGKIIINAAAKHLTPVILELGGKNPCIVDREASIDTAARKIMWGKLINAGQTCIAPDYVFVHRDKKAEFVERCIHYTEQFYGPDASKSKYYPKIVDEQAVERFEQLLKDGNILYGGQTNKMQRYVAPTLIEKVAMDSQLMKEEIFGPILPIFTFHKLEEMMLQISSFEKPLASYYFGSNKKAQKFVREYSSGGVCINDVLLHIANDQLPFGGIGDSGLGAYHGIHSFQAFSHHKSVVTSPRSFEIRLRYVPFKYFRWIKRIL